MTETTKTATTNPPVERVKVDPDDVSIEAVLISREDADENDRLRRFHADINLDDPESGEPVRIGAITGHIAYNSHGVSLTESGDMLDTDTLRLCSAADEIREYLDDEPEEDEVPRSAVVLIALIDIEARYRGNRVAGHTINQLLEVLRLDPDETLLVLQPEPQLPDGGPMSDGPDRDAALAGLVKAYVKAGFDSWAEGPVWWH